MSPSPHNFFSPLTSLFQDIGLYRQAPTNAFEIQGIPLPDPIGDIWQAEEAATAFEQGNLRTISLGSRTKTEDDSSASNESKEEVGTQKDTDTDTDDNDGFRKMAVIFRNESPVPLVLCWLSDSGEAHHFYQLEPCQQTLTKKGTFEKLNTDHLENTFPGHAFCLGYAHGEQEIARVRKLRSLFREDTEVDNKSSIVVAGYRPLTSKAPPQSSISSSSSASSSPPLLSRPVQVVTITHTSQEKRNLRRHPWIGKKKQGCLRIPPWCLGRAKGLIDDDDSDVPLDPRGWRVSARWTKLESEPYDTTDKYYEDCSLGGWPCKLEPNWSGGDETSAQKLERDIRAASLLLPRHARDYLHKHCKIWINRSLSWGPKACPVRGHGSCYHPGEDWLAQNGLSKDKYMCVEVNDAPCYKDDCDLWGVGGVMLHELSHAYHHGMLPGGYGNKEIKKCFELAMKEGLYDCVEYKHGFNQETGTTKRSTGRAYACSNAMEYFAELSAAFLGGLDESKEYNKWYPFNRKQIQEHDPRAYSLLSRLWQVDVNVPTAKTQ